MSSNCAKCGETLSPGTEVLQVAQGHYYHGFITPTYLSSSSVLLEGHRDCLADFPVEPQYGVYDCLVCRSKIKDGADCRLCGFWLETQISLQETGTAWLQDTVRCTLVLLGP